MRTLNTMEVNESGVVCWIAANTKDRCENAGVKDGVLIKKLWGRGNSAVISCGNRRYLVSEGADRIGVVPYAIPF